MRASLGLLLLATAIHAQQAQRYFRIQVVDEATGRGVPLVELTTVGGVRHWTDSAGNVAFHEPGLMGRRVFFHVRSHGYEFQKDRFGYRGRALTPVAGQSAVLKLKRVNVAERLYRITGGGIYRDSVLLGLKAPTKSPVLSGGVLGQDSVVAIPYRGKIHWFWGDTNRAAYPLGNFAVSGATSPMDLDPDKGIDLRYFVGKDGFSRPMCPIPGPGPKWISGLMLLEGRLVAMYVRVKKLGVLHERGLALFNDEEQVFERLARIDLKEKLYPHGHPVRHLEHYYFGSPFPRVRVRADLKSVQDPRAYEAFDGTRWQRGGAPARQPLLEDVETGKKVRPHGGTVFWNAHRKRWIAIVLETGGTSFLGEIWFAESKSPTGPWRLARKIVTHDRYSFYNPAHHPFLDREGGRFIHFEGTYTTMFSGNKDRTPRYDYNQILYRLDLDDPRLGLPE